MKIQTSQNTNSVSGKTMIILGVIITLSLLLLDYFNIFYIDQEIVLAPFVVMTLLACGDKLLIILFLSPINFVSKLLLKLKANSQFQNQKATTRQSSL